MSIDLQDVDAVGPVIPAVRAPQVSLLAALVARVCDDYDALPEEVDRHAADIVEQFADARVQAFVPILVERQLRDHFRTRQRGTSWPTTEPSE